MKILMLLSNPLMVDPRVNKEAKALIDKGYNVTVIVWDYHKKYIPEEYVDGIHIIRVHNSFLMRILPNNVLRYPFWFWKAYKKALNLYLKDFDYDVVHCHDLDTLQIGVWLKKKKKGLKLVYDAHEIYEFMLKETHPILAKFTSKMEKKLIKIVDHLITIDEPFKNYYKKIFSNSITIVMNCKDLIYSSYESPKNDVFTLIYIGVMTRSRFFPDVIDIIGDLDNVKLIIAGKKEALFDKIFEYSKKYENIEFLGTIPTEEILPMTRKSDATFIIADTKGQHHLNVFNKQFEAMVCGRPIIITKGTYAAEMTEDLKCGLTVNYNKKSVKESIIRLRDEPKLCEELGMNAFKAANEEYNWENEKKKLLELYEVLL